MSTSAGSGPNDVTSAPVATGFSPNYKKLWGLLLLGWVIAYADRTLTGPVIAWMIEHQAGFIGDRPDALSIGGLVTSMFFLGYMLTQYPGGRLGDQYGHREMIIVSLVWASVMTVVSGLMFGVIAFVAARVITGLGEGVFYSNDRTLILNHSPLEKRTIGLGVVISGLSIGLTIGIIVPPYLIKLGDAVGMGLEAWRMPFFIFAAFSFLVATALYQFFRSSLGGPLKLLPPFIKLLQFSAPTFGIVLVLFILADEFEWQPWKTAIGAGVIAVVYVAVIVRSVSASGRGATLLNRNIWLVYIAYIAILWNLWFFSTWSVVIIQRAAATGLVAAALTAAFNAVAGVIGFPVGGWLADRAVRQNKPRKPLIMTCTLVYTVLVVLFGMTIASGDPSLWLLGLLLFVSGLFFNALQPIVQGMTGDMVPVKERGSAFGMLNLVSEIGAVASPVVSGIIADQNGGDFTPAVYVAAALMLASAVLYAMVNESASRHHEDPVAA